MEGDQVCRVIGELLCCVGGKSFVSHCNTCVGLIKVIVDHCVLTSRVIKMTVICHFRYCYLEKKIII